ncbi:MAG: ribbon-helix-helix protein, CopG family [Terriglobales bacterium]|jgi:ribbon-helix-helix CopG family protein
MAKRLQVTLKDHEYHEFQRMARKQHVSLSEWVRQALGLARSRKTIGSVSVKLDVIRVAAQHNCPTGDIDSMLAEIEKGYESRRRR